MAAPPTVRLRFLALTQKNQAQKLIGCASVAPDRFSALSGVVVFGVLVLFGVGASSWFGSLDTFVPGVGGGISTGVFPGVGEGEIRESGEPNSLSSEAVVFA